MELQIVEGNLVAITLHNGKDPTPSDAAKLVRTALDKNGLQQWSRIDIEVFSGRRESLIVATPAGSVTAIVADYALPFFNRYFTD